MMKGGNTFSQQSKDVYFNWFTSTIPVIFLQEYLRHFYGYQPKAERQKRTTDISKDDDSTTRSCDKKTKVQEMQRYFGLLPSGELTEETLAVMKKPRCGLSDVEQVGETVRWKKKSISYRLEAINLISVGEFGKCHFTRLAFTALTSLAVNKVQLRLIRMLASNMSLMLFWL